MDFASLRADLIGGDAAIRTPFGTRRVTYADYVASGRALRSVEERIASLALPLYANTHTEDSATGAHSTHLTHQAQAYIKSQLGETRAASSCSADPAAQPPCGGCRTSWASVFRPSTATRSLPHCRHTSVLSCLSDPTSTTATRSAGAKPWPR
ncbi:hypothetical protein ACFSC4_12690 [Deinococcus malanensis]|uniref:hypothetical protein n=1 Tax=Deinococcus malanensis TaxID=1706855 RepID=UPI0036334D6F